jgi:hypothetical protein
MFMLSPEEIEAIILRLKDEDDYLSNLYEGLCDAVKEERLTVLQAQKEAQEDKVASAWFKLNNTENEWKRNWSEWMSNLHEHLKELAEERKK